MQKKKAVPADIDPQAQIKKLEAKVRSWKSEVKVCKQAYAEMTERARRWEGAYYYDKVQHLNKERKILEAKVNNRLHISGLGISTKNYQGRVPLLPYDENTGFGEAFCHVKWRQHLNEFLEDQEN